jgi:DNA-binding Xre family transcriptional regulator
MKYDKLFALMKIRGISGYTLRLKDKIVGAATLEKLRKNEGIIDTRTLESLCKYLNCQPGDIMEFIEEPAPALEPPEASPQEEANEEAENIS